MNNYHSLKRHLFFANLDNSFLKEIYSLGKIKDLESGERLFEQDMHAKSIFLILEGKISLELKFKDQVRDRLNPFLRGEIIGWSGLVKPYFYTMGAVAISPAQVIEFNGLEMLNHMEKNPQQGYLLLQNLTEIISERLINRNIQLMSLRV